MGQEIEEKTIHFLYLKYDFKKIIEIISNT